MLETFPTYMKNVVEDDPYSILNELQKRQHDKPKGRPPFSADIMPYSCPIHQGKLINYFWRNFHHHLFLFLEKIQSRGEGSIIAVKSLLEKGRISQHCFIS